LYNSVGQKRYLDVQIKARSKDAKEWNFFAAMTVEPRDNFYFSSIPKRITIFGLFHQKTL